MTAAQNIPHVSAVPKPSASVRAIMPIPAPGSPVTVIAVKLEEYQHAPYSARVEVRGLAVDDALQRLDRGYTLARAQLEAMREDA